MRLTAFDYEMLLSHGVTPSFARILTEPTTYHSHLSILVGKSDWDYFVPEDATDIVPLWDCNANSYVRWRRGGKIEYVLLLHDDPDWLFVARSEQGVIAELWRQWCEFQDADEKECLRFADTIGFRHGKFALQLWEEDYQRFQQWISEVADE